MGGGTDLGYECAMGAWRGLLVVSGLLMGCQPDANAECAAIELGDPVPTTTRGPGSLLGAYSFMRKGPVLEIACCRNPTGDCAILAEQLDCSQYADVSVVEVYAFSLEPWTGNVDKVLKCVAAVQDGKVVALHSYYTP